MRTKATLLLAFFAASSALCAVNFEEVTFGFNDGYKAGTWVPLNVTVRSQNEAPSFNGELTVEVRNRISDVPIQRHTTPLQLSTTDWQRKQLYVYCPKTAAKFVIKLAQIEKSGQQLAPRAMQEILPPTSIENVDYFVLGLVPSGDKLQKLIDKKQLDAEGTQIQVKYLPNSDAMPTQWIGYSSIDVLVIREIALTPTRISKSRQTALLDWIQRGGTLIVSGGSNFRYLKGSFIEQFLPVQLIREQTLDVIPPVLQQQFGFKSEGGMSEHIRTPFKHIQFAPHPGCHTVIGTNEQIYVAKRLLGSGQILCLSFDYNAPPFSGQHAAESFWSGLLKTHGKSPRLLATRYAQYRKHDEKIYEQFLSKMPTQVPLIKLLSIVLPVYLLSFGGFLYYFSRGRRYPQKKARSYWLGGAVLVLISISTIGVARTVLPKSLTADRFSILSVYPERARAHYQSYVSLRATAHTETSIVLTQDTFIRPLAPEKTASGAALPKLTQGSLFQVQAAYVEPWSPSTYLKTAFLDWQQPALELEDAWRFIGEEATYLGNVTLGERDILASGTSGKLAEKMPPAEGLNVARKPFAQILQREGVLQYLTTEIKNYTAATDISKRAVCLGWMAQPKQFSEAIPLTATDGNVTLNDETLVILYLHEEKQ